MRALWLLLIALAASADYVDPWGLPSGSDSLEVATLDSIQNGSTVEGFDFFTGTSRNAPYLDFIFGKEVDLLPVELAPGSVYLRAPEGEDFYDRALIARADAGFTDLESVASMEDVELGALAEAEEDGIYLLLQIREGESPESTAVKFQVKSLDENTLVFDWVFQPNGTMDFIPSSLRSGSFSEIKALY
ncbi:MAG: hypothetical protein QF492_01080 [Candidatus Krumholzibacteria bacterium]|jgi:hypothetical protein|nr:hypothetical protein [Candidatus Krumholzibacteria bacterium]MDP6668486.1 hypothetical protein [Candidatus Krumholzibacteria bacterium]MDP6797763.1 hypothetical protein [Candidatus Krumholzibacteria bacterium]MDP7021579.1 hypothetical protein [Candidatus Krumholzibacteria bacterium]